MKNIFVSLFIISSVLIPQPSRMSNILDECNNASLWNSFQSNGVEVKHTVEAGTLRFDVAFPKGSGYGGVIRYFNELLPENYEISFMMKATVPVNNFEIKVSSDSSGENIWWVNNKNYV
jgi:hypothetical protein